ncbi:DUF3141 domain-containing protein [Bosea sp. Root381]|nr:DUF3141 domain-containing protein [Bosea sp. Root381]
MVRNPTDAFADALAYATDAGQRLVLLLDALRQRSIQYGA